MKLNHWLRNTLKVGLAVTLILSECIAAFNNFQGAILFLVAFLILFEYGKFLIEADAHSAASLQQELKILSAKYVKLRSLTFDVIEAHLATIAIAIKFTETERISLYVHDGSAFVQVGRHSLNPDFQKKGRGLYGDNEGVIGVAWRSGEKFIEDLPDFYVQPDEYINRLREFKYSEDQVKKLAMKSRSLYAWTICEYRIKPLAVLVIESMQNKLDVSKSKGKILKEKDKLLPVIAKLRSSLPQPGEAEKLFNE